MAAAAAAVVVAAVAWTGAVVLFFNNKKKVLTAPRNIFNTHADTAKAQSRANHVHHIRRLSRATCAPRGARDSVAVTFGGVGTAFSLSFIS